jgi:hypothetical protein
MPDGDTVAQLAAVILLLVLAVPALSTAHEFAGTPIGYEEDATVDYTSEYAVAQNATVEGYGDDPTVTVDGGELVRGDDYRWNDTDGSGDTAQIQYRAYQRTEETALAWTIVSPFMGLFGVFALAASVRTLWSYIAEVWDL